MYQSQSLASEERHTPNLCHGLNRTEHIIPSNLNGTEHVLCYVTIICITKLGHMKKQQIILLNIQYI